MTESPNRHNMRDAAIIAGALVVFTSGYLILRKPQPLPEPPGQTQQPAQAGMADMGAAMPDLPQDYDGLLTAGNRFMDQGNYAVAAEAYRRALEIDGRSADVRTDFGACLHAMGLPERAVEEFHKVLAQDPRHAIAHFNLGIVYYEMQKPDSARYYWTKYLSMEPDGRAAGTARDLLERLEG